MNCEKCYKWLIAFLIILMAGGSVCAGVIYPLGQKSFDFDYERLYRQAVNSQDFSLWPPVGPYDSHIFENSLNQSWSAEQNIFAVDALDDKTMRLFGQMAERACDGSDREFDDLPYFNGGFLYRPTSFLSATSFFNLDRSKALDSDYIGKVYRGLAGQIETAVINFNQGKFSLSLGRQRLFWGPRPLNLLLSSTAEPLDMFSAAFHSGRITFIFMLASLDETRADAVDSVRYPGRSFNDNRYLAAHRLDIRLNRCLRIGLFETILFGGEGRSIELYYLNPLNFFHATQLNDNVDDNVILGFDFMAFPGWGTSLYGQLIVDDYQVDDKEQADQEPNEIGLMLGFLKPGRKGTLWPDIRAEYVRLTNRTYHNREPGNRYLFRNQMLGHPLGPDADSLSLTFRFWPNDAFYAEIEGAYRRQGEGSLYDSWDEPWLEVDGDYSEPFPTGTVEKAVMFALRGRGYLPLNDYTRRHLFISLEAGWSDINNYRNIEDEKKNISWVDVSVSWQGWIDLPLD